MRPKKLTAKQLMNLLGLSLAERKRLKPDVHILVDSWNTFIRKEVFELRRCWKGEDKGK